MGQSCFDLSILAVPRRREKTEVFAKAFATWKLLPMFHCAPGD
jgi:hypothetical protein